ncbi:MAG: EAL domain-containing protein [Leptospiraceae bacterium]|nr:EAL domain-containing protein [Leptospiraceae bacterium]
MSIYDQAFPHYQPIIALSDSRIYGYEVLGRYIDPTGQVQSLGSFFIDPALSELEKIRIDRNIRSQALKRLQRETNKLIFFNLNPLWMLKNLREGVHPVLLEDLRQRKIKGERIVIEIAETIIKEHINELKPIVKLYRNYGCKIAIDDFTFSDFDRLIHFKPDIVKMSMHLLRMSRDSYEYFRLIETVSRFSQELGMHVLFEGVEDESDLAKVVEAGGGLVQGYLFSRGDADFQDDQEFRPLVSKALQSVMDQRFAIQQDLIDLHEHLQTQAAGFTLASDDEDLMDQTLGQWARQLGPGVLRLYACRSNGIQISSNIMISETKEISSDSSYRDFNWAWRPFFVHNMAAMRKTGTGVISDPYIDHHTRLQIATFSFPAGDNVFVFLDYQLAAPSA